jgi:hypothetical protein
MHELVKSAIEAEKSGDRTRAQGYLKQALTGNPRDVDAWLVLAATFDDPEKKRQCLNKVLTIDPVNQIARDELLEMDRAFLGGVSSQKSEPTPRAVMEPPPSPPAPVHQTEKPDPALREISIKRSFFQVIIGVIFSILMVAGGIWLVLYYRGDKPGDNIWLGLIVIGIGIYGFYSLLTNVQEIILQPEKMIVIKLLSEEELTHEQIADIRLNTYRQPKTRGRVGRVTKVAISRVSGGGIIVEGMGGGPERVYAILKKWWRGKPAYEYLTEADR